MGSNELITLDEKISNDDLSEKSTFSKKSEKKSRKTTSKSSGYGKKDNESLNQIDSDDITLSQLELMANKKKLSKKNIDMSFEKQTKDEKRSDVLSEKLRKGSTSTLSSSSSSSDSNSEYKRKEKEKKVSRENKNDQIRKEKSEFLYKFSKKPNTTNYN